MRSCRDERRSLAWIVARAAVAAAAILLWPGEARASALARVSEELADRIKDAPAGTRVVSAPLVSDVAGARVDDLAVRLAGLVAGRLGKGAVPHDRAVPLAAARSHAKESSAILFLAPVLDKGRLAVTADLYAVPKNGWDRIRMPPVAPRAHASSSASIDAEVRTFLPAILLEQASISKVKLDEPDVLAAACGDVDGDGGLEVALVSRDKVTIGRFARGRFKVERSAPWSKLHARAPVPMRDPIATAAYNDDRFLVGITDRGGVAVDVELTPSRLHSMPVGAVGLEACARPVPPASALEGARHCSPFGPAGALLPLPAQRFDAASATVVVARDGTRTPVVAVREPQGKVRVRFGRDDRDVRVLDGGPELALFDLDLDGAPELAVSSDATGEDAISIYSFEKGAEPRLRRRLPTPAPVRALAACPPEVRGVPGLLAVVGAEVWLVR